MGLGTLPLRRTWALIFLLSLLLTGCAQHEYTGLLLDEAQPAADIVGTDVTGETFRLSDHRGELSLIFFGYTYCPDVCPLTLSNVSQAYKILEDESPSLVEDLNVVFVSVDPERDTPDRLAAYVPLFNPSFHGIYIPQDELDPVKSAYGVYAEKNTEVAGATAADYLIDHTAGVYAVDREGNLRALFKHDIQPEALAADLKALLNLR